MRVAIVGSRDWVYPDAVIRCVKSLPEGTVVVSGGARGVDTIAVTAALERGLETRVHRPNYALHGDDAPMVRNQLIVDDADKMFAFRYRKSSGTSDAIKKARVKGIPIKVVNV